MIEKEPQIIEAAMNIILNAGDAREDNLQAIHSLANFNVDEAKRYLEQATKKITIAHKIQTDQIQDETRGNKSEYSLLFAHAQDTLMTINSEILLTKGLMDVFRAYLLKIQELEREIERVGKNG